VTETRWTRKTNQKTAGGGVLLLLYLFVDNVLLERGVVLLEFQLFFYPLFVAVIVANMLALGALELDQMIL
jgi:hypothetical protein